MSGLLMKAPLNGSWESLANQYCTEKMPLWACVSIWLTVLWSDLPSKSERTHSCLDVQFHIWAKAIWCCVLIEGTEYNIKFHSYTPILKPLNSTPATHTQLYRCTSLHTPLMAAGLLHPQAVQVTHTHTHSRRLFLPQCVTASNPATHCRQRVPGVIERVMRPPYNLPPLVDQRWFGADTRGGFKSCNYGDLWLGCFFFPHELQHETPEQSEFMHSHDSDACKNMETRQN